MNHNEPSKQILKVWEDSKKLWKQAAPYFRNVRSCFYDSIETRNYLLLILKSNVLLLF